MTLRLLRRPGGARPPRAAGRRRRERQPGDGAGRGRLRRPGRPARRRLRGGGRRLRGGGRDGGAGPRRDALRLLRRPHRARPRSPCRACWRRASTSPRSARACASCAAPPRPPTSSAPSRRRATARSPCAREKRRGRRRTPAPNGAGPSARSWRATCGSPPSLTAPLLILDMGAHLVPAFHHLLAQTVGRERRCASRNSPSPPPCCSGRGCASSATACRRCSAPRPT